MRLRAYGGKSGSVKIVPITAAMLALTCGLAACGQSAVVPEEQGKGSQWQKASFPGAYGQKIEWRSCGVEDGLTQDLKAAMEASDVDPAAVQCATVKAPLDWDNPENSATTEVAISRVPARRTDKQGALFGNPGGPGEPGRAFVFENAVIPNFQEVLDHFDLIGIDPRGTGGSVAVECGDEIAFETPALALAECVKKNPISHHMGTSDVARDMELVRSLLNVDKLNYFGYSYGSMLGATYATLFPAQTGRMLLDSAENAKWATPIHRFEQKLAAVNALLKMGEQCAVAGGKCPYKTEDELDDLIKRLDASPLQIADKSLSGQDMYGMLASLLYGAEESRREGMEMISKALNGDEEGIKWMAERLQGTGPDVGAAGFITYCHSFPRDPDIDGLLDHVRNKGLPKFLGGPELTDENLSSYADLGCYSLPEAGSDITTEFVAKGETPVLVIGVTGDHATPYEFSKELVEELGSAKLLTLEADGHTAAFTGRSVCVDEAAIRYLVGGQLPKDGAVCKDDEL